MPAKVRKVLVFNTIDVKKPHFISDRKIFSIKFAFL